MPFATVNGITLPIAKENWTLTPVLVGDADDRADDGTLLGTETVRKREWTATFIPGTEAEREAFRRLVEGDGLFVDFDDNSSFAFTGLGAKTLTGVTTSASGGKRGGRAILAASGILEYGLANMMREQDGLAWAPTKGWTLVAWKNLSVADGGDGTTFVDHIATGSVVVTRGASANPASVTQYKSGVAGSWGMGNWISVDADGDVSVHGRSNSNASIAYDYDELLVLPFALPGTATQMQVWATAINAFRSSNVWSRLPRVKLGGDCIPDAQPLEVRCRLTSSQNKQLFLDGAFRTNARADDITLRQV